MKLIEKSVIGKLLWTDSRDAEGIIKDSSGNEYYFNGSSSPLFDFIADRSKSALQFDIYILPGYGAMAFNVKSLI